MMNACLVCGNTFFEPLYSDTLKRCTSCGFVTTNMEISSDLLKAIYNINYFMGEEYMNYLNDKEVFQLNFGKRIEEINRVSVGKLPVSNCLEIGCAYGFFGETLMNCMKTTYLGIDVI